LTYFIFSYYDFTDADFGIDLPEEFKKTYGRVEYRKVIEKSNLRSQNDSIVQDFRPLERLEGLQLLPDLSENKFLSRRHQINISTNDKLDIVRSSAYFSDFFVTRDSIGNARFFFSLDFRKLILENTVFGKFFSNVSERMFNDIVNNTTIRSLKVKRRRVIPLPGTNKLGGASINEKIFDKNAAEETIAVFPSTINTGLGTIRETKVFGNTTIYKHIRNFTGVDFDVSKQTYGHFQYGVEIEIEDRSIDLLVNRYNRLLHAGRMRGRTAGTLDEYINILNIPNVYNLSNLDLEEEWKNKVLPAIQVYFEIVDDLFVGNDSSLRSEFQGARNLVETATHPRAKDPIGILLFSKLVNDVLKKLEILINISSNRMVGNSSDRSSTASNAGSKSMKSFKVEKYFAELFDSDTPKNIGFDYLSNPEFAVFQAAATGLEVIGFNTFRKRLAAEMLKYYKNVDDDMLVKVTGTGLDLPNPGDPAVSLNTTISNTPIHFSPSIAVLGKEQYQLNDLQNKEIGDLCATKILSYKSTGGLYNSIYKTKTNSKLPAPQQKIKYNLLKTLETFNFTMVEPSLLYETKDKEENRFTRTRDVLKAPAPAAEVQTKPYKDEVKNPNKSRNPNLFLTKLVSGFALTIPSAATPQVFIGDQGESIPNPQQRLGNAERFNIDRIVDSVIVSETSTINKQLINIMPLQLKSIVAAVAGHRDKVNRIFLTSDFSKNLAAENAFIFNYLLLQKVEYLSGYGESSDGRVLTKRPVWRTATMNQLIDFKSTEILCRLRRFEHQNLPSVKSGEGLDIPSYDNYFIIQKSQATVTTTRERDRLTLPGSDELPIVEEIADPEFVGDQGELTEGTTGGSLGGGFGGSGGLTGTY